MAGIINITDKHNWSAANWVYWGLMDHVINAVAEDPNMSHRMEGCKWMQSLSIPLIREDDPESAQKAILILKHVTKRCASGDLECVVDGKVLDSERQLQFRESINDLVSMLNGET